MLKDMKKYFVIICAVMAMLMTASAQNPQLNPLNYSGKMYISAVEMLTTPRYISYEDHAILSSEMTVPVVQVTVAQFDFEKKVIFIDGKETKIGNAYVKEYSSDYHSTFVIYMEPAGDADRMELVWPENDNPYLLQITPSDSEVAICKMKLSHKPVAASGEDALMQILNSLGGF